MQTPIYDFAQHYAASRDLRLHMPGHKGHPYLGIEHLDITEIAGADSLYGADGIILESEKNASSLFDCRTYYSTEGSSHCLRAMLYLALMYAKAAGRDPLIAAPRNVHKTFLSAAALLELQVQWLYPQKTESYLHCELTPDELDTFLCTAEKKPFALYLTSPDYLGNLADIAGLSEICRKHQLLLLVDNAHGAYLKFLPTPMHPMELGADLCCDSAHKTLPVLTGGAYLHISGRMDTVSDADVRRGLSLFGSTSPSYLILQSLDLANRYLEDYPEKLAAFLPYVRHLKERLTVYGYSLLGDEPLKLTVLPKSYGYTGTELELQLGLQGLVCEFSDPDHLVMMLTPETGAEGLQRIASVMEQIPRREAILTAPPIMQKRKACMPIRRAALAPSQVIPTAQSMGRILSDASVGCPPAVPILVCGEQIDADAIACFQYYGIEHCTVVADCDL